MVLIIGVTGAIASGKSHLCRHLAEHYGATHLDADREAHQLYAPGTPGFDRVVAEFGTEIVGPDGVIDRKVLGAKVFGKPDRMQALRTAMGDIPTHFMGILDRWRAELTRDAVALLESINLFENGYMAKCDAGWLVVCEPTTAVNRLTATRGLSVQEAEQRLASAHDWRPRAAVADRVIRNDGTVEELIQQVDAAIADTVSLSRAARLPGPRWRQTRGTMAGE